MRPSNPLVPRKGAPFRRAVSMIQQRIIEAGLITHWVDDVVKARARKVRMERKLAGQETGGQADQLLKEGVAETQVFFRIFLVVVCWAGSV